MIGIFYYFAQRPHARPEALDKAEVYGESKTTSFSHPEFWGNELRKNTPWDYDYFPRGRVVYDLKSKKYTLYIDRCLNDPEIIRSIAVEFGLPEKGGYGVRFDEHCQCHRCNKDYVERFHFQIIRDFVDFALPCYLHCPQLVFAPRMIWKWNERVGGHGNSLPRRRVARYWRGIRCAVQDVRQRLNVSARGTFAGQGRRPGIPARHQTVEHASLLGEPPMSGRYARPTLSVYAKSICHNGSSLWASIC
jgi:hypothetical protein